MAIEANQPEPALTLHPFDPQTFQRVWRRVMPDQTHSPIELDVRPPAPRPVQAAQGASCLGEDSKQYAQALEALLEGNLQLLRGVRRLARRLYGPAVPVLSGLAGRLSRGQKRLSTAYFLITGSRYTPHPEEVPLPGPMEQAVRALFQRLHRQAAQARAAAQGVEDRCLRRLLQDLAGEAEDSASRLQRFLEGLS